MYGASIYKAALFRLLPMRVMTPCMSQNNRISCLSCHSSLYDNADPIFTHLQRAKRYQQWIKTTCHDIFSVDLTSPKRTAAGYDRESIFVCSIIFLPPSLTYRAHWKPRWRFLRHFKTAAILTELRPSASITRFVFGSGSEYCPRVRRAAGRDDAFHLFLPNTL